MLKVKEPLFAGYASRSTSRSSGASSANLGLDQSLCTEEMPLFFSGDELGAIKSVSFSLDDNKEWKTTTNILVEGSTDKTKAVRKLTLQADTGSSRQVNLFDTYTIMQLNTHHKEACYCSRRWLDLCVRAGQ